MDMVVEARLAEHNRFGEPGVWTGTEWQQKVIEIGTMNQGKVSWAYVEALQKPCTST